MVQQVTLQAEPRQTRGKGPGRRLRANGRIPAIVYGLSQEPVSISVNARELSHLISHAGENAVISLSIAGQGTADAMLRETQRDPVTERLVHADFRRIDINQPVVVEVPLIAEGIPAGVKDGGLLEQLMRTIEVKCLPLNLPGQLQVNVSEIRIGHSLHVRNVIPPEGVEILSPPEQAVFTVLAPIKEEEVVAAPVEGEVAEPELITKGKEEEEGEEEEAGGKKEAKKEKEKETEKEKEKAKGKEKAKE